jgi:site-specific DNA-methyltransferase (adenine-specific)
VSIKTNTVLQGDCLEVMKDMPDNSISLIVTDPPYGIDVIGGSKPFGSIGGSNVVRVNRYTPIINDDVKINFDDIFRVSKNQIIFGGNYFDFPISKGWIVWDKKCKNDWNDNFSDGELVWTSFDRPLKIIRHLYMGMMKGNKDEIKRVHPTQKPLAVMEWIIENYSKPDDLILDPFAGSGSTLVAAKNLGRKYIGIELEPKYVAICEERLSQQLLNFS